MAVAVSGTHPGRVFNDIPVEFVEVFSVADEVDIDLGVLGDLLDVAKCQSQSKWQPPSAPRGIIRLEQSFHALSHRRRIHLHIEPVPLQSETSSVEIPRVGKYDGRFEGTITALFADILHESAKNIDGLEGRGAGLHLL